jgi:hypothetical protein
VTSFRTLVLPLALAAAACDLPTELPRWTTSWEMVAVEKNVRTVDLLPEGVRIDPRGFAIDSFSMSSSIELGDVCELCTCFDGPIPELEFSEHEWPLRLPSGVTEVQMLSGRARVVMTNHVGFDLLDDGQGGTGRIEVALTDGNTGEVLDRAELTESWPAGDSVALDFELSERRLNSSVVARVSGRTPGSGDCDVDLTEESGFAARVELRDVIARSVSVSVRESTLALEPRSLTLPDALASRLRPGEARLAVAVELTSRVQTAAEIDLSVAPAPDALFTGAASLHTPLVLPGGTLATPADARGLYLIDLTGVPEAKHLYFAARTKITAGRVVRLTGAESIRYRMIVRAEVPSR